MASSISTEIPPSSSPTLDGTLSSRISSVAHTRSTKLTWIQALVRRRLLTWLSSLKGGQIQFSDSHTQAMFGTSVAASQATWHISDPQFYSYLAKQGSLGLAESYLRGHWQVDDLTTFLQILCRNLDRKSAATTCAANVFQRLQHFASRLDPNSRSGSRRHIAAHYDLSNPFFELFLDPTLMYSSGWFENPSMSLHAASLAKLNRVCSKLQLQATDRLLEIGTGWGGLALHAASRFGCHVTTTTISSAQFQKASERVQQAGLGDNIDLLTADYRDLSGQFDKLVSIEVIEAIGESHLDGFFRQCNALLRPGGRCVMQAIVMPEQRYAAYRRNIDFVQKYIFPGGFLPSISAIQSAVGRTTQFRLESIEDMSPHYAKTLEHWRQRFLDRVGEVRALGFDDRFIRMWEYYLCYCEAAFRERSVRVVQLVWDKSLM